MIKILVTNARSLSPKIASLHEIFSEHDLDIALITESWLKDGRTLDRDVVDLEHGTGLKILYKNRPKRGASARSVGGGVSIIFNQDRCNLRERKITGNKFELLAAAGRVGNIGRKVAVYCAYIEPRMKVADLRALNNIIADDILKLKSSGDPIVLLGGDLNRRELQNYPDIKQANFDPTRGDACLDVLMTNSTVHSTATWPPLATPTGVESDHKCLIVTTMEEKLRDFVWVRKMTRVHRAEAVSKFGEEMANTNWEEILSDSDPDVLVEAFEAHVRESIERLFPLQSVRVRSNEKPWVTNGIRRLGKKKKRTYKREGKSPLWLALRDKMSQLLEKSKSLYVDKMARNGPKAHFNAVKKLSSPTQPKDWSIMSMFPDLTVEQAGERVADYFTAISNNFTPINPSRAFQETRRPITREEVARRLKEAKKPNSEVKEDVMPRLMKKFHHLFAAPACAIFNAVFSSNKWPTEWKTETTVVIPKVPGAEELGDCRNISCTPFLSKVLEAVVLDDLRAEIPPDPTQYGGIKQCSVNHLLVDMFENILAPLDDGHPVVILGIDYQKAFNRLDHGECLRQLAALGASAPSIALVRAFLCERSMRVKINNTLTGRRRLCGGSPQGSILGCYLYCSTTRQIRPGLDPPPEASPRPSLTPPPHEDPPSPESSGSASPPGFGVIGMLAPGIEDVSSPESVRTEAPSPLAQQGRPEQEWPVVMYKYVDDTTLVEVVHKDKAIRHISAAGPTETVPVEGLTSAMGGILARTREIGMAVNCKKTQMLCVSAENGFDTGAGITLEGEEIKTRDHIKLLGFVLGRSPGVASHVEMLLTRFRVSFWKLINLRRSGMRGNALFRMYAALIRPIIETNHVVYHSMLSRTQTKQLERIQKIAVRLCFGFQASYTNIMKENGILTLEARREEAARKFVAKTIQQDGRFARAWFRRRTVPETELRRRRIFVENRAKTERYRKSPLIYLQKLANDHVTSYMTR